MQPTWPGLPQKTYFKSQLSGPAVRAVLPNCVISITCKVIIRTLCS